MNDLDREQESNRKLGRPIMNAPRTERLSMRVTADEKARMEYWAKKLDMSVTEFLLASVDLKIKWINTDYDLPTAEIARLNQLIESVQMLIAGHEALAKVVTSGFDTMVGVAHGENYLSEKVNQEEGFE